MVYQYILFDLDGTIINSAEGIIKCVKNALKSFGIDETDDERIKPFIGPPLVWSFQEFYHFSLEDAKKATEKCRERYRVKGIYEFELYEGIAEVFKTLKERGKTLALATSKPEVFAKQIMEKVGLSSYLDVITGSEMDGKRDNKEEVLEEYGATYIAHSPMEILKLVR